MARKDRPFLCHLVTALERKTAKRRPISGIRIPSFEQAAHLPALGTAASKIEQLLDSDGLMALSFEHPEVFFAHARSHSVPLSVLDVSMPETSGLEVQARLHEVSPDQSTPTLPKNLRSLHERQF